MAPIRIQRKRTKGWEMPDNTVYVGRPGEFGNPFIVGSWMKIGAGQGKDIMGWLRAIEAKYTNNTYTLVIDNKMAVEMFAEYMKRYPIHKNRLLKLRGKNLACWCKIGDPCHADVLLELANNPQQTSLK